MIACALLLALAAQPERDPWIATDKALHLSAAAVISASGYAFGAEISEHAAPRFLVGAALGIAASAAKEVADVAGLGRPSWRDFAWSAAGAGVGLLVAWAIEQWLATPREPIYLRL
jgi:uncharacterized protein YfiM (DUF2279 family)